MDNFDPFNENELGLDIDQFLRALVDSDESQSVPVPQDKLLELIKAANDTEKYKDLAMLARSNSATVHKRIEQAAEERKNLRVRELMERSIPTLESFILAISNRKNWPAESVIDGLEMAFDQLLQELTHFGLKRIECLGKEFDPRYHEAVGTSNKHKEINIVVNEVRPGFMFHGKLLRASQVIVSVKAGISKDKSGFHGGIDRK